MRHTAIALSHVGLLVTLLSSVHVELAIGAAISVFSAPDCSSCSLTVPPGESRTVYINVDATELGYAVIGAEFKVVGLPAGWLVSTTSNPAASVVLGDPFGPVGTNIGFGTGQPGPCVNLFVATITATSQETNVSLEVTMRTPPSSPTQPCPLAIVDCPGCSTGICVSGGRLLINSSRNCLVAVQEGTWSEMKRVFH